MCQRMLFLYSHSNVQKIGMSLTQSIKQCVNYERNIKNSCLSRKLIYNVFVALECVQIRYTDKWKKLAIFRDLACWPIWPTKNVSPSETFLLCRLFVNEASKKRLFSLIITAKVYIYFMLLILDIIVIYISTTRIL